MVRDEKRPSGVVVALIGVLLACVMIVAVAQFGIAFYEFMVSAITAGLAGFKELLRH